MIEPRLASNMRIGALKRIIEADGGFAMILKKGDPVSGAILVQCLEKGRNPKLYERMPSLNGKPVWEAIWSEDTDNKGNLSEYLERRTSRDGDLWVIEVDIADSERLIGLLEPMG